jgi:biotin carboxyl carrier protein
MDRIGLNDVRAILDALGDESVRYFRIRTATLDIVLSAEGEVGPDELHSGGPSDAWESVTPGGDGRAVAARGSWDARTLGREAEVSASRVVPDADGLARIVAPTLGLFYSGPRPGAPSFVDVGSVVTPTTTVGLIEAMKVFTSVPAGVDGVIVSVEVKSGDVVEFGATLMLVERRVGP